jgi:hypothetical protein
MRAVEYVLHRASQTSSGYNLRTSCRTSVTINLDDSQGNHLGNPPVPNDRLVNIPFTLLLDVCKHYCFHTYFEFGSAIFRLVLGIPQGGSLSDPLSKVYCVYCEHLWRSSIFDSTKFDSFTGVIRPCDLSEHGRLLITTYTHCVLDRTDHTPLVCGFFRRYADDCRSVCYYNASDSRGKLVAAALIQSYTKDCYIKPCTLEDEERGSSFHFLQGFFQFDTGGCDVSYVHKNADSLLAKKGRALRTLQHFWSYGQSNRSLRLATVCGKLCEIRHFCTDPARTVASVLSLCLEFKFLQYPASLVRSALFRQSARSDAPVWRQLANCVHKFYQCI